MRCHRAWLLALATVLLTLASCTPTPTDVTPAIGPLVIYPDYQDITLPCNIAPLNFMLRDETTDALAVAITDTSGQEVLSLNTSGRKAIWDNTSWRQLTASHRGDSLHVTVTARVEGRWQRFPTFGWYVSPDSIDSYLTYRLIEPGYEVWDNVVIEERCIETFDTRTLADGRELGNRCMNCHTHGGDRGQYSFFHLRGQNGGTILNRDGQLRKVTLRREGMNGGAVYGDFHPQGQYAVFSTNAIMPSFHTQGNRRFEVYDTSGDLCVADFEHNHLDTYISNRELITFPCFSADGQWIYYCTAPNPCGDTIPSANDLLPYVKDLHYSLVRIPFDAGTGRMDVSRGEVVYDAQELGGSVSFPRCSPDGRFICYCVSDYGTFPIWHRETTLHLASPSDLSGAKPCAQSKGGSSSYHCWSHNSRWMVFASKREDGQYGRAFFMHVTTDGTTSKPMVLPQADPEHDDMNLRSYNIPDLSTMAMPFGQKDVKILLEDAHAEAFD